MKYKGRIIGGIIGLLISIGGCLAHSIEHKPDVFMYYMITLLLIIFCTLFGAQSDFE